MLTAAQMLGGRRSHDSILVITGPSAWPAIPPTARGITAEKRRNASAEPRDAPSASAAATSRAPKVEPGHPERPDDQQEIKPHRNRRYSKRVRRVHVGGSAG